MKYLPRAGAESFEVASDSTGAPALAREEPFCAAEGFAVGRPRREATETMALGIGVTKEMQGSGIQADGDAKE